MAGPFNIVAILQDGRLAYEALLFMASLRAVNPDIPVYLAEPQPGPKWDRDPRLKNPDMRAKLEALGAQIVPFENHVFGGDYPHSNKMFGLTALPKAAPFVFFDTDTLFLEDPAQVPFRFHRPCASLRREDSWPSVELYGPGYTEIWKSLYDRFGLDFDSSLDLSQPDEYWERYLYFNAGWFFYECPHKFADHFSHYAAEIWRDPPKELEGQALTPWLDQIVLPLVIHALGGRRRTIPEGLLDGRVTCHWRTLPLLYAREDARVIEVLETVCAPNQIKKLLKQYEPFKRLVYQGKGDKVRALFEDAPLPKREQGIRKRIKAAGLWMR